MNLRSRWFAGMVLLVGGLICGLLGGPAIFGAYLLGVIAAFLSLVGWWAAVRSIGESMADETIPLKKKKKSSRFIWIFLIKLPVVVALFWWTTKLPAGSSGSFTFGFLLVYFALVGWAQARD